MLRITQIKFAKYLLVLINIAKKYKFSRNENKIVKKIEN